MMCLLLPMVLSLLILYPEIGYAFHSGGTSVPIRTNIRLEQQTASSTSTVDISENAPRDISTLYSWSSDYGIQTASSFEITTLDGGYDMFASTTADLPNNSPVGYVPSDLIMSHLKARMEFGSEVSAAERALKLSDHTAFYLILKILKEHELGLESPWYYWLNSLPRFFSNAASMTDFCYSCLPPYAAKQAQIEKKKLRRLQNAVEEVPFLNDLTKYNTELIAWAYNVVHTRYHETQGGDWCLVPMMDFFNHGGDQADVSINFDENGDCYVYTTRDVPAGSPLRIQYGDTTNPSLLLVRFGFLDESSPGTYCKWIAEEPSSEIYSLGYPNRMLFYQDGTISTEVWDVFLFTVLGKLDYNEQQAFYQAHVTYDEAAKARFHEQYFSQTLSAIQGHVNFILSELDELSTWQANTPDTGRHPRLPLIMNHNQFVRGAFETVQQTINSSQ